MHRLSRPRMGPARHTLLSIGLLFAGLLMAGVPSEALGQEEAPATPGVGDVTAPSDEPTYGLDAGATFARVDEDYFADLLIGFNFAFSKLRVGVGLPLRLRVIDKDPEDGPLVRSEDWDEPSDWLRILRYVQWSTPRDTYYVRAGELVNVTMGHGTVIDGYSNILDINHFQWGIHGAVNYAFGGTELLLDNIVDPEVMALRPYVRPWVFVDPESYWANLAFGMTIAGDIDAPRQLLLDDSGLYIFDDEKNFVVEESAGTWVLGFDVELQAFTNDLVSVTPYSDVNIHFGQGSGFHLGTLTNFSFTEWFQLNTRLEFRVLGEGYEASYFDRLYEVERFLFAPLDETGQRRPKLQVVELAPPPSRIGWYGELTFAFIRRILLTVGYEDYEGDDNSSVFGRLSLPQIGPVTLGAYYVHQNFDGVSEMFDLDNALLVAEARVFVAGPFYLIGQYARRWTAQEDGTYEPVDDWGVGAGVSVTF